MMTLCCVPLCQRAKDRSCRLLGAHTKELADEVNLNRRLPRCFTCTYGSTSALDTEARNKEMRLARRRVRRQFIPPMRKLATVPRMADQ